MQLGASELFSLFSGLLTAAVVLFVLSAVTRGLHLDGLMDVCDGIFGGHTPERRLEIMKDPHVGAFGVVGLVLILLLKFGALASLNANYWFDANSVPGWWSSVEVRYAPLWEVQGLLMSPGITLLLFPVLSRWSMVVSLGAFPYARTQGLGSPFHQGGIGISTAAAALIALALAVVLGGFGGAGAVCWRDRPSLGDGLGNDPVIGGTYRRLLRGHQRGLRGCRPGCGPGPGPLWLA